mgnify:CR=1 FL=1
MEEIETIRKCVTDEVESLIVVNESGETEGSLNPSSSEPANVNEDEVSTSGSSDSLPESPWPKLNKFFSVHSTRNQNLSFECLLCRPKKSIISTYITSHSNLRKHVQVCYLVLTVNCCSYHYFNVVDIYAFIFVLYGFNSAV